MLMLRNIKTKEYQPEVAVLIDKPSEAMTVDTFSDHLLEFVQNTGLISITNAGQKGAAKSEEQILYAMDKETANSKARGKN